ncbi:MAG: hypothetical protein J1E39_00570 [Eubacterium sp.]|nr:hypothetical protein [Eubacterium sp.]
MKAFVIVLKILLMIATGAIAIVFNIFGGLSTFVSGVAQTNGIEGYIIFWIIFTALLYVVPTFLVMLKKYVIAAAMSFGGMICVFILHELLQGTARELYLPMLVITVLNILIAIFGNWNKIHEGLDEREKRKNAAAPSILGGTTAPAEPQKKSSKSSSGKNKKKG